MIELQELWGFSIISLVLYSLQAGLRKVISIFITLTSSPLSSSSSSSLLPLSWFDRFFTEPVFADEGKPQAKSPQMMCQDENQHLEMEAKGLHDNFLCQSSGVLVPNMMCLEEETMQESLRCEVQQKGMHEKNNSQENCSVVIKLRKRPARLVVPELCPVLEFGNMSRKLEDKEFEVEGRDFFLASKKGKREIMEDGYGVMVDLLGDPKQAFFTVIDGHGGRAAADYVAENLGKNIVKAIENVGKEEDQLLEKAIRGGYLVTDREFLSQGAASGACAATVLLKDGELHVANVGDCRVVLSRKGVAAALTNEHRACREDERLRIENSGGFVHCRNGVWRVQGSLAVSRAIGDLHLKDWIISEPEINKIHLTSDCEFLIMASDGLWDKVNDQEAVDVVLKEKNSLKSCKELVHISCSRGNMDDITVMVINLQKFVASGR